MSTFPRNAAKGAGISAISVKSSPRENNAIGGQPDSLKPRHIENAAFRAIAAQADAAPLDELYQRIIELERIAAQPNAYPDEAHRPARPLYGKARYHWIGRRVGLGWHTVKLTLEDAEQRLIRNMRAGLDGWGN